MHVTVNILLSLFFLMFCPARVVQAVEWQEAKGNHFVVCYAQAKDRALAENTLSRAEEYYQKVASMIGYTRYARFWTWGDRVNIFLFPSRQAFHEATGQPSWSRGGAFQSEFSNTRAIATYVEQPALLGEILPHEIAHLILTDFLGGLNVAPKWFEEGVAQLAEENKAKKADLVMRIAARMQTYFSFTSLEFYDVSKEGDAQKVDLFYLQSVSMVDFLIKRFGSEKFGLWCRQMASGKSFSEAFRFVYGSYIDSWSSFEKKWVAYLKE